MFQANMTFQKTISMVTEICCNCGVAFGLPSDLQDVFKNDPEKWFYCPNGHRQHYSESREKNLRIAAEKKLIEERDKYYNIVSQKEQVEAQLVKVEKKLKRVQKGVCPCCSRSFTNLKRHMECKHPDQLPKK